LCICVYICVYLCIIVYIVVTPVIGFDLPRVNKLIVNHHETSICICCTHATSCHLQLDSRMDNFTDLPKVAICSSDIDSETSEAI